MNTSNSFNQRRRPQTLSGLFTSLAAGFRSLTAGVFLLAVFSIPASAQIAAWDFFGETTGVATSSADLFNVNLDSSGDITRGSAAPASTANHSFRTAGFQNDGIAVSNTDYFQITLSAATGHTLSLSTIDAKFAGTPTFYASPGVTSQFAYSLDGSTFTLIGSPTQSSSLSLSQISLSGISALQNVPASTTVTLRYYASGQTTTGGWGFNSPAIGQYGLAIGGTLTSADAPGITSFSPATGWGGTAVVLTGAHFTGATAVKFNGTDAGSFTVDSATQITCAAPTGVTTGRITVTNASGTGTSATDFTAVNMDYTPPNVVVNKYFNTSGAPAVDLIELLVIGDQVPGHTVDMRGMIVKDFTSSMAGDGGGKFQFSTDTLWSAVPVGTLIVLSNDNNAGDIDASDDLLKVGLTHTTYFTKLDGAFDIATTEMVMIKAAGSGAAGISGAIHALAGGAAGDLFNAFGGPKLIASGTTGAGKGVIANNSTSTLDDFNGSDATGNLSLTATDFGVANGPGNLAFIQALRGTSATTGYDGWASGVGNQSADQDYDGNGIANGVEYFMGTSGNSNVPNPQIGSGGPGTVAWPRAAGTSISSFKVEVSSDLTTWEDASVHYHSNLSITSSQVSFTLPNSVGKLFVRLSVTP